MFGDWTYFKEYCDKLVNTLTVQNIRYFRSLENDLERIKFLYHNADQFPIQDYPSGKNYDKAVLQKSLGNNLYQLKQLREALDNYNEGILNCPQNNYQSKELLAMLIANRSAVLHELSLWAQCCSDIDWVIASDSYPERLYYKILLRKGKCYLSLQQYNQARIILKESLNFAIKFKLAVEKIQEIKNLILSIGDIEKQHNSLVKSIISNELPFEPNPLYPSASINVDFDKDSLQGRYAVAKNDIPAGAVIVTEEAFCSVISKENFRVNCSHCLKSVVSPYPCKNCAFAGFCSLKCEQAATYHRYECPILPTIYGSGASINCIMALRMITQKSFDFFWSLKDQLENPELEKQMENEVYDRKDYRRVFNLCTHSEASAKGSFVHYTFMAIYILRLLKTTAFFPLKTHIDVFTDEEAFIGCLILRHLQIMRFNAHEVSEMRNVEDTLGMPYINAGVGAGLYPTLALFNHSCEPSIIRYHKGSKIVARSIKFIKAGEIIYENYGPLYCISDIHERFRELKESYLFNCCCIPCTKNWPLYSDMANHVLRLKCTFCSGLLIVDKDVKTPFAKCSDCNKMNNVMNTLMALMRLDTFTEKAEAKFKQGEYEAAIKFYTTAMEFYSKYMVPPFEDLIMVQQRLKTCMVHDGNTEIMYKKPSVLISL